jgi:hypothetical protein
MKDCTSVPDVIPPSLDREQRGCWPLVGPLSFIEIIEDLHPEPDGVVVFSRKQNDGWKPLGGCTVAELRQHQQGIFDLLRISGFMTINTVFLADRRKTAAGSGVVPVLRHCRRREVDLRWLNSAHVDIDCGKLGADPSKVLSKVLDLLWAGGLPKPTHVSFSGNGLWLFWKFAKSVRAWPEKWALLKRLNKELVRLFRHLGADPQSTDAARVTRCPGTVNSKNGKTVQFFRIEACKFSFDELMRVFQVPAQKTQLPGERKSGGPKNPKRVAAGKLRYARPLTGFFKLCEIRGFFPKWTRHQAIFGFAVLLFKNGVAKKEILVQCTRFAREFCLPPVTDKADIERRVNMVFRYKCHIRDATFAEWFCITEREKLLLPEWFRPKLPPKEPAKVRVARRRSLIRTALRQFGCGLSRYKLAQLVAGVLQYSHGITVTSMTIQRDLAVIAREDATMTNISLLNRTSSSPFHLSNRNVCVERGALS